VLVVCPGIQLDWNRTEGLEDALGKDGVSSNYRFDLAPRTCEFIRNLRSGTAVFTVPSGAGPGIGRRTPLTGTLSGP
jgi:sulfide:quinone oxidoreductase